MMVKHAKLLLFWLILGGVCVHVSCNSLNKSSSVGSATNTPTVINQNTNTVNIEIFIIRLAPHQNEVLQQLWQEVDEQSLSPQLRRELFAQGFRVGILGNLLSPALARLLNVSANARVDTPWGDFQEFSAADATRESATTRNMRILSPEMRTLVKLFDTPLPELSLFWEEHGMFCGQTYREAIGLVCVSATANKDGSAQIQIIPEVEYGVLEQRLRMQSGVFVQEISRPRHSLETLTVSQRLLPGQWLIMGVTTLDSAGAGKAFFVRKASVPDQRLLAIRFINATSAAAPPPSSPTSPKGTEAIIPERN